MALDSFNLEIEKLYVLPELAITLQPELYPNTTNIVYRVDGFIVGEKQGISHKILVNHLLVPYESSNNANDIIAFSHLTENVVSSWANTGLYLKYGTEGVEDLKIQLEKEIDIKSLSAQELNVPWRT